MVNNDMVSVIMCVYNAGEFFRPGLESVINQTYRNLDIIVVDDGSTDRCIESAMDIIGSDPRIRLFRQRNLGKPAALNRALGVANGVYYAMQDADDLSHAERIERQVRYLEQNADVAGVFCGMDFIINGRHMAPHCEVKGREQCRREIAAFYLPGHDPTPLYRMSLVGNERFCEQLRQGQGVDYILRIGEKHPLARIGPCLYSYRFHRDSFTKRHSGDRQEFVRAVLLRACERRGLVFDRIFPNFSRIKAHPDDGLMVQFLLSARTQKEQALRREALLTGLQAVGLRPFSWEAWKALSYAVAPIFLIKKVRDRRITEIVDCHTDIGL